MGNESAARLKGDDYQHLFSWGKTLELLMPSRKVMSVRVEDPFAWSVDDVTLSHAPGAPVAAQFFQVKYHVDQRTAYSTEVLLKQGTGTSLLSKLWGSYRALREKEHGVIELSLVTNWAWDPNDPFGRCISGEDAGIKEDFVTASARSDIGQVRQRWLRHLQVTVDELSAFSRALRFRIGHSPSEEQRQHLVERMEYQGLAHDDAALLTAVGIVREWITQGAGPIDRAGLDATLDRYRLRLPTQAEPGVLVVLNTITSPFRDVAPDYLLDWCAFFQGPPGRKGHQLLSPDAWNTQLLPELQDIERRVKTETMARLVRARGASRLAPWIAFGFTFPEVAGYVVEIQQRTALWRTDAPAGPAFELVELPMETISSKLDGARDSIAIVLNVTDHIESDVASYLRAKPMAASIRVFAPRSGVSPSALGSAGDAVAFAQAAKRLIRSAAREAQARRVLLFYCGPASGACFLGHWLNAAAPEILVMEHQQPGYAPTFILR